MTSTVRAGLWCCAAWCLAAAPAVAESRAAPTIVVGPNEVVAGDLYAAGSTVRVEGIIEGDLVTTAGTVEIPGQVKGDVLAATGMLRLTGQVGGSLRVLGGQLSLSGPVGDDVLAGVGDFTSEASGAIGRDLLASAGNAQLRGPVGRDVKLASGAVTLGGPIAGSTDLTVQTLEVEDGAQLGGALTYRSPNAAVIGPQARLGAITHTDVVAPRGLAIGFFFSWARAFFAFTLLGVLLAFVSPRFARAVPEVLRTTPWHSLGWGALVLLASPFVAFALFTAGLLLGGWWLGLIAGGLVLTAMALSFPVVGYQVGHLVLRQSSLTHAKRFGALVLGVAGVTLLVRIPLLGAVTTLGVVLFGLGSMLLAGVQLRRGLTS